MPEDITISFVRESYPRELFKWFRDNNYIVEKPYGGIYYIVKEGFFVTQIIVLKAYRLAEFVADLTDKEDKDNADAVLQVAMQENMKLFDMLKEDEVMCDALREFFKDELQEANERGIAIGTEIGTANGIEIGKAEAIIEILEERGQVPANLAEIINSQKDLEVLKQWVKLAARVDSVDDFETAIGLVK